jgi:hypothetical protein
MSDKNIIDRQPQQFESNPIRSTDKKKGINKVETNIVNKATYEQIRNNIQQISNTQSIDTKYENENNVDGELQNKKESIQNKQLSQEQGIGDTMVQNRIGGETIGEKENVGTTNVIPDTYEGFVTKITTSTQNKNKTTVQNSLTTDTKVTQQQVIKKNVDKHSDNNKKIVYDNKECSNRTLLCKSTVYNPEKGNPLSKKTLNDVRIVYQNINSLRPKTTDKWKATLDKTKQIEADVVGLVETCINWNINDIRKTYNGILGKAFKINNMVASKIPNEFSKVNLPGGTTTITVNAMTHKIESSIVDKFKMGRWTGNCYRLNQLQKLNIITAYRVIDQKVNSRNSLSSNSQQHQMLKMRNINDNKPRAQFIADFNEQFSGQCGDENIFTILMIDANENISNPETNSILEIINKCGLVNAYHEFHDDTTEFPTHINGSRTIDYMLVTRNILPYITKIGYIKFHECFDSDHRGIYCDISSKLFENGKSENRSTRKRLVGTNSTNYEGTQYIQQIYRHLVNNNIITKAEDLLKQVNGGAIDQQVAINQLDRLDKSITDIMLKSEVENCKKKILLCGHQQYNSPT